MASESFEEFDSDKKAKILEHVYRVLKIAYHFIDNRLMRPNIYYLLPTPESSIYVTYSKESFKVNTNEVFCIAIWVNLQACDTENPRNIISLINQDNEGLSLQYNTNGSIQVLASSKQDQTNDQILLFDSMSVGIWNYITMIYENRPFINQNENHPRQYISIQINEKQPISKHTEKLSKWQSNSMLYSIKIGNNLMGQVSSVCILKGLNKTLNNIYKDHYTMKLSHKRNISFQNDFLEKNNIKDVLYMLAPINYGNKNGTIIHRELTTDNEIVFNGMACVVHKTQHIESIESYGGFEPILMLLSISSNRFLKQTTLTT